jgi:hypothetical protein
VAYMTVPGKRRVGMLVWSGGRVCKHQIFPRISAS